MLVEIVNMDAQQRAALRLVNWSTFWSNVFSTAVHHMYVKICVRACVCLRAYVCAGMHICIYMHVYDMQSQKNDKKLYNGGGIH